MRFNALIAPAFALTLVASPAKASDANQQFMAMMVVTAGIMNNCPGYESIDGAIVKYADMNGADFETYGPPAFYALAANSGMEYDRTKLVPNITRFVRDGMLEIGGEIVKSGAAKFCKKYVPIVLDAGIIKKISK